jgi:hypothetical protein
MRGVEDECRQPVSGIQMRLGQAAKRGLAVDTE